MSKAGVETCGGGIDGGCHVEWGELDEEEGLTQLE